MLHHTRERSFGADWVQTMKLSFQRKICGVFRLVTQCIHPGAAVLLILTRPAATLLMLYTIHLFYITFECILVHFISALHSTQTSTLNCIWFVSHFCEWFKCTASLQCTAVEQIVGEKDN